MPGPLRSRRLRWLLGALAGLAVAGAAFAALRPERSDPCPGRFESDWAFRPESRAALLRGEFSLLRQAPVRLVAPVDWEQDPYDSKPWRNNLHAGEPLAQLLGMYSLERNRAALIRARDLALDWIAQNPPREGFGWKDKRAGDRVRRLAYLTAAAQCAGVLSERQRETLRASVAAHGEFLADPEEYDEGNHGLFQNTGLAAIGRLLPTMDDSEEWDQLARRRFREDLPVQTEEMVGLEHSPRYHFVVLALLEQFIRQAGARDPGLRRIAAGMRRAGSWFVMPDGTLTRLGDTGVDRAPPWAIAQARRQQGVAPTTRSGFGIVRAGGGYLSVSAGYHDYGHKQADELTFELFDRGRRIVTDTGRYGARRSKKKADLAAQWDFANSSQAHSTLVVDGVSFPVDEADPYGSGITATGSGAGWWAIQATNPLLRPQGVAHERTFLYQPDVALLVVDRVTAQRPHSYTRLMQMDPGIAVQAGGRNPGALSAPGFSGWLTSVASVPIASTQVVEARRDPLQGFIRGVDKFAPLLARPTVVQTARAASATFVTVLSLDGRATAELRPGGRDAVAVALRRAGRRPMELSATRRGRTLSVTAR